MVADHFLDDEAQELFGEFGIELGVFGDVGVWDVNKREGGSEEFFWRLVKVAEPPFARGQWTHVAITWDGVIEKLVG